MLNAYYVIFIKSHSCFLDTRKIIIIIIFDTMVVHIVTTHIHELYLQKNNRMWNDLIYFVQTLSNKIVIWRKMNKV